VTKVKVYRISSTNDPESGRPGKQIELVEVRQKGVQPAFPGMGEDEARMVRNILGQFQALGLFPQVREMVLPKITLFLSEEEYDMLGITFEVNEVFDLVIREGTFSLKKSTEGV